MLTSSLNAFLKRFLGWSLLLILLYPMVIYLSAPYFPRKIKHARGGNGHMWSRLREADFSRQTDILVVGSSIAYRGIDPRAFDTLGIKLFNLGSSAQTPIQSAYLIEKYYSNFKPTVVIWDVNFNTFQNSGLESFIDVCSNQKLDGDLVSEALYIRDLSLVNTLVYVSLKQSFTDYFKYTEAVRKKDDVYISGGFVEKDMQYYNGLYPYASQQLVFRNYQTDAFENAIGLMKNKGTKVVLIFAPVTQGAYQAYTNRSEINKYFESIVDRYKLSGFLNYNENHSLFLNEHQHFYDEYHLNQQGVRLYNQALIQDLSRLHILDRFESANQPVN